MSVKLYSGTERRRCNWHAGDLRRGCNYCRLQGKRTCGARYESMVPTGIARCKRQPVFKEHVTWHLRLACQTPVCLTCTRNPFNTILTVTISHRSLDWQNPGHTHGHQTRTRTASCNWLLTYVTRWLCIDEIFLLFCFILIQLIVCLLIYALVT